MNLSERGEQRRRYKRFVVQGGTIGVIRERYPKMGQLMDIGLGGLSFRYFNGGTDADAFPRRSELSIRFDRSGFHMENIPFRTVGDYEVKPVFLEMRQRCIAFGDLAPHQLVDLEYFVNNLTSGPVIERRFPELNNGEGEGTPFR